MYSVVSLFTSIMPIAIGVVFLSRKRFITNVKVRWFEYIFNRYSKTSKDIDKQLKMQIMSQITIDEIDSKTIEILFNASEVKLRSREIESKIGRAEIETRLEDIKRRRAEMEKIVWEIKNSTRLNKARSEPIYLAEKYFKDHLIRNILVYIAYGISAILFYIGHAIGWNSIWLSIVAAAAFLLQFIRDMLINVRISRGLFGYRKDEAFQLIGYMYSLADKDDIPPDGGDRVVRPFPEEQEHTEPTYVDAPAGIGA